MLLRRRRPPSRPRHHQPTQTLPLPIVALNAAVIALPRGRRDISHKTTSDKTTATTTPLHLQTLRTSAFITEASGMKHATAGKDALGGEMPEPAAFSEHRCRQF